LVAATTKRRRRVTIREIAERAGVSKGAVSYALNDKPGISDATRERILAIAEDLGWYPNHAARSLSAARAGACGIVVARTAKTLALEPFYMEFLAGVESELSSRSIALTTQLVENLSEELRVYRRWWGERRVDGVLVMDYRLTDPRVEELVTLGFPAVVVGGPVAGSALPSVWHDESWALIEVVRYLAALGHTRIARVAGLASLVHTADRTAAFRQVTKELSVTASVVSTDYTPEAGARATRQLLSASEPPTAFIYDSDLLAVAGLGVVQQMGFSVPDDLSIVAWDDSLLCQVVHPALTAVTRDITKYGAWSGRRLLAEIEEHGHGDVEFPRGELTIRGSTSRASGVSAPRTSRPRAARNRAGS
jgi:DNA-binding LacI/PurR family transcriptional regulator